MSEMAETYLQVGLGNEHYAIPADSVLEVAELGGLTAVPGAPSALIGVCNLRGTILPVIDLAAILRVASREDEQVMLVARYQHALVGLAAGRVIGVEELPPSGEPAQSPHLTGAVLRDGALIGVIDLDSVIDSVVGEPTRV